MEMSRHAYERSQQRAISSMQLDLLIQFGTRVHAGQGTTKVYFDKAARKRIQSYAGSLAEKLSEYLDVYAVLSDEDKVVTTSYLSKRIRHV